MNERREKCPLGLCNGSGFVPLYEGEDEDGPMWDEDNCLHTLWPPGWWTPEHVAAALACYNLGHRTGDPACPYCGPAGVSPGVRL